MFDVFLGKRFTVKCKHAIKCINERLKPIRNRKQAVVNILKKDVAELLRNGGDMQAFNRMDELLVEMNRLACYDMIDNFCQRIYKQLQLLQKQRECPPEDMEAVATLIFAAARFSDLPELCNLRTEFLTHYGNPMEGFVNSEFKEKVSAKSFPPVKRIQLMEDIACEFSVSWNPSSFNHNNPAASGRNRHAKNDPPKKEAAMANHEGESVKKTSNKVWSTEPENLTPAAESPTYEDQQKKLNIKRREAQPFKAREEIADQPNSNVDLEARTKGNTVKEECEKVVDQHKRDDTGRPAVTRKTTRAHARVSSIGEDSPNNKTDCKSTRENSVKEATRITLDETKHNVDYGAEHVYRKATKTDAIKEEKEEKTGLGPRPTKERSIHTIPPPYVKSITIKTELPGKEVVEAKDERSKPRSVRRKPPPDERRIADLNKEEDVDQLLIYYSKKRLPEQKGKERVADRSDRRGVDQLADRFSHRRSGSGS